MFAPTKMGKTFSVILVSVCVILFSILTVYLQVLALDKPYMYYLEKGLQIQRHMAVLQGTAGNPWQYRVLADYLVEAMIQLFKNLDILHPIASAFISFRFVQNLLIFLLGYAYYRKLGLSSAYSLIGLSLLAWGMTYAYYDSDLQFNTYFDVIFYLLAGLAIVYNKQLWMLPLMLLAAFNRETSGLIPFLSLALVLPWQDQAANTRRRVASIAALSLALFAIVFVGLRLAYPNQVTSVPHGHSLGLDLLQYNLFRATTWVQLFATLSIIPVLALLGYKRWHPALRVFFWVIVPIWFGIHLFTSVMAETRVFLVPQVLIFIPGALFFLKADSQP
jgi:hypothetical protein